MDQIKILYGADGKPVAIDFDGTVKELDSETVDSLPRRTFDETSPSLYDVSTSIRSTVEAMKDSYDKKGKAILVDIEATHFGYANKNYYHYLATGGKKQVDTWTTPYFKPYLVNHDMHSEPRGRVVGAKFVPTGADTGYHALDVKVGHSEEIEMILDSRALTVSVGSLPVDTVECSVCGHDLYRDGPSPKRYQVEKAPSKDWLRQGAKGVYGAMGLKNEDLWAYRDDEGKHSCRCLHQRGMPAPRGGQDFEDTSWHLHGQTYREVSRVNLPADQNNATGEFAHIRKVLKMADGLAPETAELLVSEAMSKVDRGSVDRARFQVVMSEDDLFTADTAQEAVDYATRTDLKTFFDAGLWIAKQVEFNDRPDDEKVAAYQAAGGRFVKVPTDEVRAVNDINPLTLAPRQFGDWLRTSDLSRDERHIMDKIYTARLLRSHTGK